MCEDGDPFAGAREMFSPREGDIVYLHDTVRRDHTMGLNNTGRAHPAETPLRIGDQVVGIERPERLDDHAAAVRHEAVALGIAAAPAVAGRTAKKERAA